MKKFAAAALAVPVSLGILATNVTPVTAASQSTGAPGVVSEPPASVKKFLETADPVKVTTKALDAFLRDFNTFLMTADGSGTNEWSARDSKYDHTYGSTISWVIRDGKTIERLKEGGVAAYYSPAGKYIPIDAGVLPDRWRPNRAMFDAPKSQTVKWAIQSTYTTDCEIYCVGLAYDRKSMGAMKSATVVRQSPTQSTWAFTLDKGSIDIFADTSTGQYDVTWKSPGLSSHETETQVVKAEMVTPEEDVVLPARSVVATYQQYVRADAVNSCGVLDLEDFSAKQFQRPTAKDLRKVAGKLVKKPSSPCTYTFPENPGKDGSWFIQFKYEYGTGKTRSFYYTPKTGAVEVPEYRTR